VAYRRLTDSGRDWLQLAEADAGTICARGTLATLCALNAASVDLAGLVAGVDLKSTFRVGDLGASLSKKSIDTEGPRDAILPSTDIGLTSTYTALVELRMECDGRAPPQASAPASARISLSISLSLSP